MQEIDPKDAFSKFRPERVIFVISVDENGRPSGMAVGRCMSCSSNPPSFAVAIGKNSYTGKLIHDSKEFVVAVPGKNLEKELLYFGSVHGDKTDKFNVSGIQTVKSKSIKSPLLADATLNFECVLENEVDSGDHTLFIGRVLHSYFRADGKILMNMGKVNGSRIFDEFDQIAN